jgi:nicotinamidase-related amidase
MEIKLPVRFTGSDATTHAETTLVLPVARTALLLIDCNGDCGTECNAVIQTHIAPALHAARQVGMKAVFVYNEGRILAPASRPAELHTLRRGSPLTEVSLRPVQPTWADSITPRADEPIIAKRSQNAFVGTYLDSYLRSWGIDTLLMVGFSFKSCLFYSMIGAFEREYRVIFLRDGTHPIGTNEYSDTVNLQLDEGGWVRLVLTRLIEDHLGYSSTCAALVQACVAARHRK